MKVIRSGEKGFREEKARMCENPEEVNKMPLTKKEQLEKVFTKEIRELLQGHETVLVDDVHIPALEFVNSLVSKLLYEVKIRTKL